MTKTALITGITGQDGSFLAEFLLEKGYDVHGIIRRSSSFNTGRIEHLYLARHEEQAPPHPTLWRHDRLFVTGAHHSKGAARRNL